MFWFNATKLHLLVNFLCLCGKSEFCGRTPNMGPPLRMKTLNASVFLSFRHTDFIRSLLKWASKITIFCLNPWRNVFKRLNTIYNGCRFISNWYRKCDSILNIERITYRSNCHLRAQLKSIMSDTVLIKCSSSFTLFYSCSPVLTGEKDFFIITIVRDIWFYFKFLICLEICLRSYFYLDNIEVDHRINSSLFFNIFRCEIRAYLRLTRQIRSRTKSLEHFRRKWI